MPDLPAVYLNGELNPDFMLGVWAWMHCPGPEDGSRRAGIVARVKSEAAAFQVEEGKRGVVLDPGVLRQALNADQSPLFRASPKNECRQGRLVGLAVVALRGLSERNPRLCSKTNAYRLMVIAQGVGQAGQRALPERAREMA